MPDAFAYDHEGRFLGMNAFIRVEAHRLAVKVDETAVQVGYALPTSPYHAHALVLEFLASTRTGVRSFESYSLDEILEWIANRPEANGA